MVGCKYRVLLIFGTRPEAIKMAPVYMSLLAQSEVFEPLCCVTGQHRGMLDQVLDIFGIVPDFDLRLMRDGQSLTDLSGSILAAMRPVLMETAPDLVLVQGDTTSATIAALAAFYEGIPVGHVEAGLRTHSLQSPFPEELNRRLTGVMARYHFAPTQSAMDNLVREGCDPASILLCGNTVVDAVHAMLDRLDNDAAARRSAEGRLDEALPFDWRSERFVLVTCHRRESQRAGLAQVCEALRHLVASFPDIRFVLPVHPSPAVREVVWNQLSRTGGVSLIDPLPYDAFLLALRTCQFALTDSGGVQEEAPSVGKPVLVIRDTTERVEGANAGHALLVGTDPAGICSAASRLLRRPSNVAGVAALANPYGDGSAGRRIADFLKSEWLSAQAPVIATPELLSLAQ